MRNVFVLFRKDLLVFIRDRTAVALTFLVPAVLIFIFGMIFGGGGDSSGMGKVNLLVVDEAGTATSAKLVQALSDEESFNVRTKRSATGTEPERPLTREDVRELLQSNARAWRHAVILPPNVFATGDDFGFHVEVIQNQQSQVESQVVEGLLQKVLYQKGVPLLMDSLAEEAEAELGEGVMDRFHDDLANAIAGNFNLSAEEVRETMGSGTFGLGMFGMESGEGDAGGDPFGGLVDIQREKIFGKGRNPAVQSVGGWGIMFLLFSLSAAAASLMAEKREGVFLRLLSGPVTRLQILWSKFVFTAFIGLVQLTALLIYGELIYNIIDHPAQVIPLAMVAIAAALASSAFGMILASFSKTEAQASGLATLLILSMSALGGAMFPIFMLPDFIRDYLAPLTLVYWAMDGFYGALWRDEGPLGVLPQVGVLLTIAAVALPVSIWRFRTGDLFR